MTHNKNCHDCGACATKSTKTAEKTSENVKTRQESENLNYGFYSNVLKKPFANLDELKKAEYVYFEEQKAKENKAAQKKADAQKVEDAFKALNAARKSYKEDLAQLTKEYAAALENLKKAFELGEKDIYDKLAAAEEKYSAALKEFTTKHESGYHLTLKDGDFETTISGSKSNNTNELAKLDTKAIADIFDWFFKF